MDTVTVLLIGDLWFMVLLMVFLGVLYFSSVPPTTRAALRGSFFCLPQTLDGHPELIEKERMLGCGS